jgi:hypothetical protein
MGITCSITKHLENSYLQWYGHVQHMQEDRWPERIFKWSPTGKWRGRLVLVWETYIKKVMEDRGLGWWKALEGQNGELLMEKAEKEECKYKGFLSGDR